ncbi:MAG: NAD-dependent epimerase/dehydratase family protein [Oscillospiraceae bacterium]|nr:NAD-dependent epimerase/dehydratase family protein [Oscillospiraceae bacterium]
MFGRYYITGATGFLGRAVTAELSGKGAEICALVLENDALAGDLPDGVSTVCGDVCDDKALERFLSEADENSCVIHCAGIVSVASDPGDMIYRVNAGGTNNILRHCERRRVGKLVYVSSVHAIPEKPKGTEITEQAVFSPELVKGDYAKSKAIATSLVFDAAERGLNASVVFPSGIIGPGDSGKGSITNMLLSFAAGKLPFAVKGGYDFVDVRDVAAGIAACAEHGLPGHGYILSGQYASVREILNAAKKALNIRRAVSFLPISLAKLAAPCYERRSLRKKRPLFFTPYSVAVLESNSRFSRKAAEAVLGYAPRSVESSVGDMVRWLKKQIGQ